MDDTDKVKSLEDALKSLLDKAIPGKNDFVGAFAEMVGSAEALSKEFGIGRQRMDELMVSVTNAIPAVTRLGGNIQDTVETIKQVSNETKRNVVANEEQVSKLFATSEILGKNVSSIVGSFQEVGVEFTQIGGKAEESIQYIQSIGGNVREIMTESLNYMSQMNKFNFQDGVLGVTRMAAQASLLKTDMRVTLGLAEEALDPDRAIELASAFQRLGVSASDLTDPFQLMNKSLNDPEGLQNSIVNMSKQFAYFDEEAKQFKINPQGMLMLREIGKQANLDSKELANMALNAADLDKKLSQISPSIQFAEEEDKKYLANIAKMGQGGKYVIEMGDEKVELEKLSQQQIDKLIEEQKKGPKTVEDLQRAQLDAFKLAGADVQAIKEKIVFGTVSNQAFRDTAEGARSVLTAGTGAFEESVDTKFFRKTADKSISAVTELIQKMSQGTFSLENMKSLESQIDGLKDLQGKVDEGTSTYIEKFLGKLSKDNHTLSRMVYNSTKKQYDESKLKERVEKQRAQPERISDNGGEIMGEIKTTTSNIDKKIDNLGTRIDKVTTPAMNQSTITEKIVREIQTTIQKNDKEVVVSFDPSKPASLEITLKGDGNDFKMLESKLLNNESIKEAFTTNIVNKMKELNLGLKDKA